MERLAHPMLIRGCRIVIGVIFALAGLAKIGDPSSFSTQVHNFRLVPVPLDNLVAMTLPWIEVVIALALIAGVRDRAAAWLSSGMMIAFTVAVALAVVRGLDIECGCFGTSDAQHVGLTKLGQNTVMLLIALVGSMRRR